MTGITGTAKFTEQVIISEMILPEFSHSVQISAKITVTLIDSVSHYDLILGRDFCSAVGIDVLHSTQEVVWQHTDGTVINTIPFCSLIFISNPFDLNVACFDALAGNDDMEINNIFDPLQDFKKYDVEQIAAQ